MNRRDFSFSHLELVNEILPRANAEAAYRMGVISSLSLRYKIEPTRELFEGAIRCSSLDGTVKLFEHFRRDFRRAAKAKPV